MADPKALDPAAAAAINEHLRVLIAAGKRFLSLATFGGPDIAETGVNCPPASIVIIQAEVALAASDLEWAFTILRDHLREYEQHPDLSLIRATLAWHSIVLYGILMRWGFEVIAFTMPDGSERSRTFLPPPDVLRSKLPLNIAANERGAMQRTLHLLEFAATVPRVGPGPDALPRWIRWPVVDLNKNTITRGDDVHHANDRACALMSRLVEARGAWVDNPTLTGDVMIGGRPDRARDDLRDLKHLVEAKAPHGYRLIVEKLGVATPTPFGMVVPDFGRSRSTEEDRKMP